MKLTIILGNQLFPTKYLPKDCDFFMCEEISLCNHFNYHQQKITLFLTLMRKYQKTLKSQGKTCHYFEFEEKSHFFQKLKKTLSKKYTELHLFSIEDKFFEKQIIEFAQANNVKIVWLKTPMFLTSREEFKDYLKTVKKPFMKSFYEEQRKKLNIMMENNEPLGGKFSFDEDNRKKIPKKFEVIHNNFPSINDSELSAVIKLVKQYFPHHPGDATEFWYPIEEKEIKKLVANFITNKLYYFGDFQDALDERDPFLYHSLVSVYINMGIVTPLELVKKVEKSDAPINAKEGFIRQVIGWREFVRGIYQNYDEIQQSSNFFNHQRKLTKHWYEATTGILPLDQAINKAQKYSYCHHIERLMVLGNLMTLCEIHPQEAYRWFMEMFSDSSDWVMGPNVFGMALFSDGGIFATKPYIASSNYLRKMGHYKKAEWCDVVDGLYWRFIDKNREFFKSNYRLSMMVKLLDKMDTTKKKRHMKNAENFIATFTQ